MLEKGGATLNVLNDLVWGMLAYGYRKNETSKC
jgi:hypothetical protein